MTVSKFIIYNETDLDNVTALELIKRVVDKGLRPPKYEEYEWGGWKVNGFDYYVYTDVNEKSHRFTIAKIS